jgi:pyruvate dehydrogenase E2 component (dihydrolipoamide acetyltransferase)
VNHNLGAGSVIEVKMPQTTDEPQESLVVFWYKSEGDKVQEREVLVEVQTEKATFDVEAPASGVLRQILVRRGETAAVGDVLARIQVEDEARMESTGIAPAAGGAVASEQTYDSATSAQFVPAPPRMRRLAAELGVDLARVQGTGPNGRITEADVRAAVVAAATTELEACSNASGAGGMDQAPVDEVTSRDERGDLFPLTPTRRTIARRMMESLQKSAQLTLTAWADVTALATNRKRLAPGVSWNTWVMRAAVLALQEHPELNAAWEEEGIRRYPHVHLGIAVDTDEGLLVPVIRHTEALSLEGLHEAVTRAAEKARTGQLTAADLTGGTFTVTNLGMYGIEFFTPIINSPEAAILGVGQVDEKLILQDGVLTQVERMPLSLTFDHRVIDGAPAARFLNTMARLLAEPERLV